MDESKKTEFIKLFKEFVQSYPPSPDGQKHVSSYAKSRQEGVQNFEEIQAVATRGEDVNDSVLLKLLPHVDCQSNRTKGAWTHHAPAITGNLKKWYESTGKVYDWNAVAKAILRFVHKCNDNPSELEAACTEFSSLPNTKGFQVGMLTPILNALRPADFLLINSKSQKTINYFANTCHSLKLTSYPAINTHGRKLVQFLAHDLRQIWDSVLRDDDQFDIFCHWLVSVKKYSFSTKGEKSKVLLEPNPDCLFTPTTFELLAELHAQPRKSVYLARKDEFKEHLEEPFQKLFRQVATQLPDFIKERMETESKLFARILKNDFKHGGAWDFYWGAFYLKGGKRIEDAQLFMWMNHERLEFGFYIGQYGSKQRQQFLRNCQENYQALVALLEESLSDSNIVYASRLSKTNLPWQEWLKAPDLEKLDIHAAIVLPKQEVLTCSTEQLIAQITQTYERLFPLVLLAIYEEPMPVLLEYLEPPEDDPKPPNPPYSLTQCAQQTRIAQTILNDWLQAIERKKQAVLYGPPGTGKTYLAKCLANHLISEGDGFVETVQFHPAYTYEDFIQGIRPKRVDGGLDYSLVPGRFLEFCKQARSCQNRCVLIIDEMNRANIAQVFGELMYLLEYREQSIPLAAGEVFSIPANVRIIGTMNTADRSIALVDHALRRRFAFLPLYPNYDGLYQYHQTKGFLVDNLIKILKQLNQQIGDRHYEIGTTFFLLEDLDTQLRGIWQMEIEPYLEEYFFDQPDKVEDFRWHKVEELLTP